MIVCVPIAPDGRIRDGWGRAERVAVADVADGDIRGWEEFAVAWDQLHDEGTEGSHHARIARFLIDHGVQQVVAGHMGPPMQEMLRRMGIDVRLGAAGDAREAVLGG